MTCFCSCYCYIAFFYLWYVVLASNLLCSPVPTRTPIILTLPQLVCYFQLAGSIRIYLLQPAVQFRFSLSHLSCFYCIITFTHPPIRLFFISHFPHQAFSLFYSFIRLLHFRAVRRDFEYMPSVVCFRHKMSSSSTVFQTSVDPTALSPNFNQPLPTVRLFRSRATQRTGPME